MAAMAAADGVVDPDERKLLCAQRWSVPWANVELALKAGPGLFDRLIEKGSAEAEIFLKALIQMALIDKKIDRAERRMLAAAAHHLGIPDRLTELLRGRCACPRDRRLDISAGILDNRQMTTASGARDKLFLLAPHFEDPAFPGKRFFCWHCALLDGLLASFPDLASRLMVERVSWPRPRQSVIELVGESNQSLPLDPLSRGQ
jgi:hypothetical protein